MGEFDMADMDEATGVKTCVHHWLCESPTLNPRVTARCKLCGAERTFRASMPELPGWVAYRKAGDGAKIDARIREVLGIGER